MSGFYLKVYDRLPQFLKRRINPLEYSVEEFVRSANSGSGRVVLDAGAGEARYARYFSNHVYVALDSTAGDPSWDYSRIHIQGDLASLPLAPGSVDTVVSTQVLEHVPDPVQTLKELQRVLRPGGRLYLTAPQGWHEHQAPNDYFRFTRYSLERILEQAGFVDVAVHPLGGYFHYLGHRLTYIPKVLFQDRQGLQRALLFPLELGSLFLFCLAGPILCFYLDRLDNKKEFTLLYRCTATKRG